jgi:REP element-mobilizing transposase RayT
LTSFAFIRRYVEKNPDFTSDYIDSIREPINIISEGFKKLTCKLKGEPDHVHNAETGDEIKDVLEIIHVLDQDYNTRDCKL